ncbi:transcription termination/antitermination protein NusG [Nibricoccus sp. IMCC34717]|uniref:transcription termination/antitermination protein NusG n=1 Tax=Nibricoccus sp. IMCC34717 TaxID=3034021 RepID=UPI00384B5DA3
MNPLGAPPPQPPTGVAWYCLKTRNKRESFAANQLLERTKLEVFAPRLETRRKGMRPDRTISEPLFPSYIFCNFDFNVDLRFVLSTPDITGIVRFGDRTPPVSNDIIAFLQAQTGQTHCIEPVLVPGEWIHILTGTFMGEHGQVLSFDAGKDRALILLTLLGRDVRVSVPLSVLQTARQQAPAVPPQLLARGP